jgi:hypothetical protein
MEFTCHNQTPLTKKERPAKPAPCFRQPYSRSVLYLVALLEPLYTPGGVNHPALAGKERMTGAAQLDLHRFSGRTGGEGVATGTDYTGIVIIFGVNFILHSL